ncbi:Spi family protease inhibitor [Dyadobacter sp. LJ53]|uniref:Spi family protease inhibitor n=1 Tax=Dyadobacter chenwenxiniae TaxID=2906456 RepID=UPI001F25E2DB|nr:Spi family protease inhibitor [Dyadobacter chenwenxiniae]MCF0052790.1 Spi family protease inhibitor [Dyadobacter chenwenxiniae]
MKNLIKLEIVFVFYIVNYEDDKGFTLLSAYRRMKPVLAFSDNGTFDDKTDNPGIQMWFDITRRISKEPSDNQKHILILSTIGSSWNKRQMEAEPATNPCARRKKAASGSSRIPFPRT